MSCWVQELNFFSRLETFLVQHNLLYVGNAYRGVIWILNHLFSTINLFPFLPSDFFLEKRCRAVTSSQQCQKSHLPFFRGKRCVCAVGTKSSAPHTLLVEGEMVISAVKKRGGNCVRCSKGDFFPVDNFNPTTSAPRKKKLISKKCPTRTTHSSPKKREPTQRKFLESLSNPKAATSNKLRRTFLSLLEKACDCPK